MVYKKAPFASSGLTLTFTRSSTTHFVLNRLRFRPEDIRTFAIASPLVYRGATLLSEHACRVKL
jgi:hypothetical protein